VGQNGTILKTTNGGMNWVALLSGTSNELKSVYFTDFNTGYVVGGGLGGVNILKTTNGGTNSVDLSNGTNDDLISVFFIDAILQMG
jgi:photosystem II stability/assembly factor-like uncharacterized protein